MKILSAKQIREADAYTISHEPISSIALMERAAKACVDWLVAYTPPHSHYVIICGRGNNGGDGLAICRLLSDTGRNVSVSVIEYTEGGSPDFLKNLARLEQNSAININKVRNADELVIPDTEDTIIIDAILGTGINRQAEGLIAEVVAHINTSGHQVVAIDVPSGLPIDSLMDKSWPVVKADYTLTFQQPKLAFMFPESGDFVGEFQVLDIGLNRYFIDTIESDYAYLTDNDITSKLKLRAKFSHKGTYGHSLIIAGGYGKMGAALLASGACLRCGTGLLTTHLPGIGYQIMQTSLPEVMVSVDKEEKHISTLPDLDHYTAIGIGPGMGQDASMGLLIKKLLQTTSSPLVIDADALNILGLHQDWLYLLPANTIISPHPKEFDRLSKVHKNSWDRLKTAQDMAQRHKIVIVLKGGITATVLPDRSVLFNSTGNPGLAKGGSGDVLTGVLTAMVSRGYTAAEAAYIGVYVHGLAADLAISDIQMESLIATDVINFLSYAFEYLYTKKAEGKSAKTQKLDSISNK